MPDVRFAEPASRGCTPFFGELTLSYEAIELSADPGPHHGCLHCGGHLTVAG